MLKLLILTTTAVLVLAGVSVGQEQRTTHAVAAPLSGPYQALSVATTVSVVRFSEMGFANRGTVGSIFGAEDDADLAELQNAVAASPVATGALELAGLGVDDVIALRALSDGAIYLYVDDSHPAP